MKEQTQHTPGPWNTENALNGRLGNGDLKFICNFEGMDLKHSRECRANARLIASSPELLEALKGIIEGGNVDRGTYWKVDISDINVARAAIAKAEGGDENV